MHLHPDEQTHPWRKRALPRSTSTWRRSIPVSQDHSIRLHKLPELPGSISRYLWMSLLTGRDSCPRRSKPLSGFQQSSVLHSSVPWGNSVHWRHTCPRECRLHWSPHSMPPFLGCSNRYHTPANFKYLTTVLERECRIVNLTLLSDKRCENWSLILLAAFEMRSVSSCVWRLLKARGAPRER